MNRSPFARSSVVRSPVRSAVIPALVLAGALLTAGCSGPSGTGSSSTPQPAAAGGSAGGAAAASAAGNQVVAAVDDGRLITAAAIGTVTGTPDVLTVSLGVETRSDSAHSALDENNRLANDVITVIKANGVAPEDLQTSQLSISPTYDDKSTITGYQVTNMVTARLRDIGTAGALIDAVGAAAGNAVRVQQLSFSIDDDSDLRAQARADAVRRAQAQAQQMADAAGVALGAIHSITETTAGSPIAYERGVAVADAAAVPIEPGSQQLSVSVQVVYEIAG